MTTWFEAVAAVGAAKAAVDLRVNPFVGSLSTGVNLVGTASDLEAAANALAALVANLLASPPPKLLS